ncbi:peptidoglycan-binding protein [Roseinatronobacter alkalisoli]|uniref:Peptidoglycan-binding protein n=1 Tax=Roseinatronobacter alkalisoli TaxID=3028235 RepID=A0ABT5T696_9RHOB|nr:peptidoglycan-binding protein [Roseinatronobacter sp. HJB301]MDD7970474.1 peptidoglycan-binding protein [Roseinatronobacter sp. HJB301]
MRLGFLVLFVLLLVKPLHAAGLALVIANDSYDHAANLRGADQILDISATLESAGFQVVSGRNLTTEEMRAQLAGSYARIQRDGADRVIVVLAGHFVHSRSGAWFLGVDADEPGLAMADSAGLRLDVIMEIATGAAEAAQLWLAGGDLSRGSYGDGLAGGLPARLLVPQGVGVVRGPVPQVGQGLRAILRPGAVLSDVVDQTRGLSGEGTISPLVPLLPAGFAPVARADRQAWADAQQANTEAAYQSYLDRFPNGLNAQAARGAIDRLRNSPERIEDALALTRDERRAIQRDLTTLGFNTRGVDGIFGPGTRAAIRGWQGRNNLDETGFLNREQVMQLAGHAARRAAEIEAEERARREVAERDDRAFWDATGAGSDEAGLRSYLERYPQGIFAGLARERLDRIEADSRQRRDRAAWDQARRRDSVDAYESYLVEWPDGAFAADALVRIDELDPPATPAPEEDPQRANDRAAEEALQLTGPTRVLIERRLARMGLDPGAIDGTFDAQSRSAIEGAQRHFDLPPTGYVTQDLITMMLGDTLRSFFE